MSEGASARRSSTTFANRYFEGRSPLGASVRRRADANIEIIVVADFAIEACARAEQAYFVTSRMTVAAATLH